MTKFLRPCLDCGTLARGSRCETHQALHDRKANQRKDTYERRRRKAALYDLNYKRERKRVVSLSSSCHLCGKAFEFGDRVEADHLIPGNPASPLAAAHRRCNQSRGNKPLNDTGRKE
jgi:hypothetical protein